MANFETAVAATLASALAPRDEALDILREANGLCEEVPASEERPALHLVTPPPAVTEAEPEFAPEIAPLARTCPQCGAQVANLASVWSEQHGLCKVCAAPLLFKEQAEARKQAKTCACGNYKRPDRPLCRDCYEKQSAEQERRAVTCQKCGKEKERHHRVCGECYRASLPQRPAPKGNGRPEAPTYKVDPKAQARAAARAKLGQALLVALRAWKLEDDFPGAEVKHDDPENPMVTITYKGDSYTMLDASRANVLVENRKAKSERHARNKRERAMAQMFGSDDNGKSKNRGRQGK
jgi:hypothetical protein